MKKIIKNIGNLKDLFALVGKGSAFAILFFLISSMLESGFPLLIAYFNKILLAKLETVGSDLHIIIAMVCTVTAVSFVKKVLTMVFSYVRAYISSGINFTLKQKLYEKCERLPLRIFDDPSIYDRLVIAERLSSGAVTDIATGIFKFISGLVQYFFGCFILASFSPWLLWAPIVASLTGFIEGRRSLSYEDFDKRRTGFVRRMDYFKTITTQGFFTKEIKVNGMRDYTTARYNEYNKKWNSEEMQYSLSTQRVSLLLYPLRELVIFVLPAVFFVRLVSNGEITIADFSYYISMLTICHSALNDLVNQHFSRMISSIRIRDYMDFMTYGEEERNGRSIPMEWLKASPAIEFCDVSFRYSGSKHNAVDRVNLFLAPGEHITIIGENGAGKTTLIKLLCGLYEPSEGKILIDGIDSREFAQKELYQLFSVVFQDYATYEATLRDTLSMGSVVTDDEIIIGLNKLEQSKEDNIFSHVFNCDLSTKLGKTISHNGLSLSGGENQKLALARALIQSRSIAILDEATASLDAYAEMNMLRCFAEERQGKTTVMISHRIGSAKMCNRILVLSNGRIVEDGTHNQLINNAGAYAKLYATQAGAYRDNN